jgi:hypothetical protein
MATVMRWKRHDDRPRHHLRGPCLGRAMLRLRMGARMTGAFEATAKRIRNENLTRLTLVQKSLAALKNQDGQYARDHRDIIAMRREMQEVIDRHIAARAAK